jgi:hypothetical protein
MTQARDPESLHAWFLRAIQGAFMGRADGTLPTSERHLLNVTFTYFFGF